jgi:RNA recognition motif-containing protein
MNVFVAKLSPATTSQDLEALFGVYGEILSVKVIFDRETGNSKGYGFVEMKNDDEARAAIEALNDSEVNGNQIVVKEARPKEEHESRAPRKSFQRRGESQERRGGFQDRKGGFNDRREGFGNRRY